MSEEITKHIQEHINAKSIQIFIRFNGENFVLDIMTFDSISSLKNQIITRCGIINPNKIYLVYNGRILKEETNITVADYNIQQHHTIHANIRFGETPVKIN